MCFFKKRLLYNNNSSKILIGTIFFICVLLVFRVFMIPSYNFKTLSKYFKRNKTVTLKIQREGPKYEVPDNPSRLIDLTDFEYLINQPSCSKYQRLHHMNNTLLTVILVHSAPKNMEKRQAVRDTWGQKDPRY